MSTDAVDVQVRNQIATVTLNRPQRRNAMSAELITGLRKSMAKADADPDVRVIILAGAGSAFCAGMDLHQAREGTRANVVAAIGPAAVGRPWDPMTTPVIGAINGPTYTGGLEIALHCDILIASTEAQFADTHGRVGGTPGWGMSVHLPQAVGAVVARTMSLTGLPLAAERAMELGLVYDVTAPGELMQRAHELATAIVSSEPETVAALLRVFRATAGRELDDALRTELELARQWYRFDGDSAAADR